MVDGMAEQWLPQNEAELDSARREGVLSEDHFVDAKQELPPARPRLDDPARDVLPTAQHRRLVRSRSLATQRYAH